MEQKAQGSFWKFETFAQSNTIASYFWSTDQTIDGDQNNQMAMLTQYLSTFNDLKDTNGGKPSFSSKKWMFDFIEIKTQLQRLKLVKSVRISTKISSLEWLDAL